MRRLRAIRLVAMREILERGRSRGYLLSLVFTVFLLVAGFLLPAFLLGQDESPNLALVGTPPAGLQAAIEGAAGQYDVTLDISTVPDRAAAEAALRAKTIDAALDVPADLSGPGELIVLEEAENRIQAITSAAVIGLRAGADAAKLEPPTVDPLEPPTEAHTTAVIFANAGIILMFIGIFTYGTWVLTGVVEEKQSRVVEVVLTTVRPRDLLMGKVLGIGLLALVQLLVLVAAGIAAAQLSGRLELPPTTAGAAIQLVTWFILGFAFYSTAMGFLGSLGVARGRGVERVAAGDDDRDPVLPGLDPAGHAGAERPRREPADVLPAVGADGRAAARRARCDPGLAGRRLDPADAGRDLGAVRGRRTRVLGRHPPDRRPDEAPGRLARLPLIVGR